MQREGERRYGHLRIADADLLQPLPVVVDGVLIEPADSAEPQPLREVIPHAVEAIDAICTRMLERRGMGGLAPWLGSPSSMTEARPPTPPTTFSRIVELDPAALAALPGWWERRARNDRIVIERRLSLSAPHQTTDGVWTMRAALRRSRTLLPLGMELSMWRHLNGWTKVTLVPRRRVLVRGFYFENGHRALDVLCARMPRELG